MTKILFFYTIENCDQILGRLLCVDLWSDVRLQPSVQMLYPKRISSSNRNRKWDWGKNKIMRYDQWVTIYLNCSRDPAMRFICVCHSEKQQEKQEKQQKKHAISLPVWPNGDNKLAAPNRFTEIYLDKSTARTLPVSLPCCVVYNVVYVSFINVLCRGPCSFDTKKW